MKKSIKNTPNDGVMRIFQTRVTLDTLIQAFHDGATAEEFAQQYSILSLAGIYSLIGYYLHRRPEIEAYMDQRRQAAAKVQEENGARFNPQGIRVRLLARRASASV